MCPISMTYAAVPALRAHARAGGRVGAARSTLARATSDGALCRHGDDREAGRLRRARQHHARRAARATARTRSPATSGSAPTRCATSSSCSRRRDRAGLVAASLRRGRAQPGFQHPAAEGQARHALAAVVARSSSTARCGRLVGEEGRGVPTIIEMVNHTRLDCLLGCAPGDAPGGGRGRAPRPPPLARSASCSPTSPLMQNVLADLAHRVRGGDRHGHARGARLRRGATSRRSAAWPRRS